MKFRKLRIAWSVACGVACVLLIALWVRSYCRDVGFTRMGSNKIYTDIASNFGIVTVYRSGKIYWRDLYLQAVVKKDQWTCGSYQACRIPSFGWRRAPGELFVRVPYWILT